MNIEYNVNTRGILYKCVFQFFCIIGVLFLIEIFNINFNIAFAIRTYTSLEQSQGACSLWGGKLHGANCKGDFITSQNQRWLGNFTSRAKLESVVDSYDPTNIKYAIQIATCYPATYFGIPFPWDQFFSRTTADGCLVHYSDGVKKEYFPQDIIQGIITWDGITENLNYKSADFNSMGRDINVFLARVNKDNRTRPIMSEAQKAISELKNKLGISASSYICAFATTTNRDTPELIGCISETINPAPDPFNQIANSSMKPYLIQYRPNEEDLKTFFNKTNSKFESPVAALQFPGELNVLTYLSFDQNLIEKPNQRCTAFVSKYGENYFGYMDQNNLREICVFKALNNTITCPTADEINALKNKEDNFFGCVPRAAINENSDFSIIADFAITCGNPYLDMNALKGKEYNTKDIKYIADINTDGGYLEDKKRCKNPEHKQYRAVKPMFINVRESRQVFATLKGNDKYNVIFKKESYSQLFYDTPNDEGNFQLYKGRLSDLQLKPDKKLYPLRIFLKDLPPRNNDDLIESNGIREYLLYDKIMFDPKASFDPGGSGDDIKIYDKANAYYKDSAVVSPTDLLYSSLVKFDIAAIIPSFEDVTNKVRFKKIQKVTDAIDDKSYSTAKKTMNCNEYIEDDKKGGFYYSPAPYGAGLKIRKRKYCKCDDGVDPGDGKEKDNSGCKPESAEKATCTCDVCGNKTPEGIPCTPDEISYIVCPGVYDVAKIDPKELPNTKEEKMLFDKICIYPSNTDNWNFIEGSELDKNGVMQIEKKGLICTQLPTRCSQIGDKGGYWSHNAIWADKEYYLSGEIDIKGKCNDGYEIMNDVTLKEIGISDICPLNLSCCVNGDAAKVIAAKIYYDSAQKELQNILETAKIKGEQINSDYIKNKSSSLGNKINIYLEQTNDCFLKVVKPTDTDKNAPKAECVAGVLDNFSGGYCVKIKNN